MKSIIMNRYTENNIPKSGKALKIWNTLADLKELHYNPNLWGRDRYSGWGTWACTFNDGRMFWCGADVNGVYLQSMEAPYEIKYIIEDK